MKYKLLRKGALRVHEVPLVDVQRFLQATRESGYRSTATALAELIDNSLQARATSIEVRFDLDRYDGILPRLAVVDNGDGMSSIELSSALQFGGSSRFNDRKGAGRFGIGLPNASLSQARRVDLYTWDTLSTVRHAFLDVDLLMRGEMSGIPRPVKAELPEWIRALAKPQGTAVIWSRCDRILTRRPATIQKSLVEELGRMFRRDLQRGRSIRCNGQPLSAIDPVLAIPSPTEARVELLPTVRLEMRSKNCSATSTVEIQFSCLPLEEWSGLSNEEKREYRISNWAGVSVLRANREVAYGWYFMPGKRRENYDDWWRCEVAFEPLLDEHFGVINSKQGIRPSSELLDVLVPLMEGQARTLNRLVRTRFEAMRRPTQIALSRATKRHSRLALEPTKRCKTSNARTVRGKRYRLTFEDSASRDFIRAESTDRSVNVVLNRLHPFYTEFYQRVHAGGDRTIATSVDCLLLALGRSVLTHKDKREKESIGRFIERLSDSTALLLGKN